MVGYEGDVISEDVEYVWWSCLDSEIRGVSFVDDRNLSSESADV